MFDDLYLDELHSTNEDYILNMDLSSSCTNIVQKDIPKDKNSPPVEVDAISDTLLDTSHVSPSIVQISHIPTVNLNCSNVDTVSKGIGSYLVKTPDFFKTLSTYSENGTDVPYNTDMKSQENSLFKFPMDVFMSSYKRRSYSETDITNINKYNHQNPLLTNTHQNNSQDSHLSSRIYQIRRNSISVPSVEDMNFNAYYRKYYSTTYIRSTVESCIDPRSFYKNVHPKSYNKENFAKPFYSYAQMITRAISSNPDGKLSLGEIYKWIESNFDYYKYANPVWKNSIRHNLSLSKCFKKVPREPGSRGKGGKWMIDKDYLYQEEIKKKKKIFEDDENKDVSNLSYNNLSSSASNGNTRFY